MKKIIIFISVCILLITIWFYEQNYIAGNYSSVQNNKFHTEKEVFINHLISENKKYLDTIRPISLREQILTNNEMLEDVYYVFVGTISSTDYSYHKKIIIGISRNESSVTGYYWINKNQFDDLSMKEALPITGNVENLTIELVLNNYDNTGLDSYLNGVLEKNVRGISDISFRFSDSNENYGGALRCFYVDGRKAFEDNVSKNARVMYWIREDIMTHILRGGKDFDKLMAFVDFPLEIYKNEEKKKLQTPHEFIVYWDQMFHEDFKKQLLSSSMYIFEEDGWQGFLIGEQYSIKIEEVEESLYKILSIYY